MTKIDYVNALNERIYRYLGAKVRGYQINPFILKFSLIVEPFQKIINAPLVVQDGPSSFEAQEYMEAKLNKQYLEKINQFLDELEA